jgi:protein-arginine kinase
MLHLPAVQTKQIDKVRACRKSTWRFGALWRGPGIRRLYQISNQQTLGKMSRLSRP